MTTLTIDIHNEEEEKAVLAFLDKLKLTYRTSDDELSLSEEQQEEILRREKDFEEGRIKSEPWSEVKKRFARS